RVRGREGMVRAVRRQQAAGHRTGPAGEPPDRRAAGRNPRPAQRRGAQDGLPDRASSATRGEALMGRILVADDEPKLGRGGAEMLTLDGHPVTRGSGGRQAIAELQQPGTDLVITDLKMPEVDGMAVLAESLRLSPPPAVIVMTGHATTESAVGAMKAGAADYLTKPFAMDELRLRVRRLCDQRVAVERAEAVGGRLTPALVGESPRMQEVLTAAAKVAPTSTTVLLLGESGTGKSQVARRIHYQSAVSGGPLVEVHCAALPETLLEGELFGHEKGA